MEMQRRLGAGGLKWPRVPTPHWGGWPQRWGDWSCGCHLNSSFLSIPGERWMPELPPMHPHLWFCFPLWFSLQNPRRVFASAVPARGSSRAQSFAGTRQHLLISSLSVLLVQVHLCSRQHHLLASSPCLLPPAVPIRGCHILPAQAWLKYREVLTGHCHQPRGLEVSPSATVDPIPLGTHPGSWGFASRWVMPAYVDRELPADLARVHAPTHMS